MSKFRQQLQLADRQDQRPAIDQRRVVRGPDLKAPRIDRRRISGDHGDRRS
jgi:hypothetical protein